MSLSIDRFNDFFEAANCRPPFPWQMRLAHVVFSSGWPQCIDLPTASGKTACIDIAVFVAACQAGLPIEQRTVGRRVFFTVNRRVIVDEAFSRSKSLAEKIRDAEKEEAGILRDVACALRSLNEETDPSVAPPLAISQLRGGVYRDASWARSLTQPIIVCTTVDQLGSRMLFRGYGVSDHALPIHAALTTHDATILLDEAHVSRAFCQTLSLLERYQSVRNEVAPVAPPFSAVQMTATPQRADDLPIQTFQLDEKDFENSVLKARQEASKPTKLVAVDKKKSLIDAISSEAVRIGLERPLAVGIIVNRVQTARDIARKIEEELAKNQRQHEVHLVIGRMRPIDRDDLQVNLRAVVGPDRPSVISKTVFVVSTQCLEVGADYDFDALLTECASIDALRQRFGRLNRAGRNDDDKHPIRTIASIYLQESTEKCEDPIYGTAINETWDWMQQSKNDADEIDFGISALKKLWDGLGRDKRTAMSSPSENAAVLLPAHLDLLCQTSPRPTPEPEIGYFIHGPQRNNADVNVCWRADLGDDAKLWPDIVRLLPPTSLECMSVPIWTIRRWIAGKVLDKQREADVAVTDAIEDFRKPEKAVNNPRNVLRWRGSGDQTTATDKPDDISPGDTVVLRVQDRGWDEFGHIPGVGTRELISHVDIAEACSRSKTLRYVVRLHSAFPDRLELRTLETKEELRAGLFDLAERQLSETGNKDRLQSLHRVIYGRFERHNYPRSSSGIAATANVETPVVDQVLWFKELLPKETELELPSPDYDDECDNRSSSNSSVTLPEHTSHVVARLYISSKKLSSKFSDTCARAAAWHDIGKADLRFQAMLSASTAYEVIERKIHLAKSDARHLTESERAAITLRAQLPRGFRHEFLSSQIVESRLLDSEHSKELDADILLRMIESHHGYARPFASVVFDQAYDGAASNSDFTEIRSVYLNRSEHWPEVKVDGNARSEFVPPHRLDSGITERFWKLTRRFGWWGLAFLETMLRLADQQASAAEQRGRPQ